MTVTIASLLFGTLVGYLGQRSRMCTIGGLRDYILVGDTALLKGAAALVVGAWVSFGALRVIAGTYSGHGLIAAGTAPADVKAGVALLIGGLLLGFVATLSGACPLRQHVLAGQGRVGAWWFLAGFYLAAVVYTSWLSPTLTPWTL